MTRNSDSSVRVNVDEELTQAPEVVTEEVIGEIEVEIEVASEEIVVDTVETEATVVDVAEAEASVAAGMAVVRENTGHPWTESATNATLYVVTSQKTAR